MMCYLKNLNKKYIVWGIVAAALVVGICNAVFASPNFIDKDSPSAHKAHKPTYIEAVDEYVQNYGNAFHEQARSGKHSEAKSFFEAVREQAGPIPKKDDFLR